VIQQRVLCQTSTTRHGRHVATDRRRRIVAPDDRETMPCSAACARSWLVSGLPADLEARTQNRVGTASEAAA
jgi:hypothetical protein